MCVSVLKYTTRVTLSSFWTSDITGPFQWLTLPAWYAFKATLSFPTHKPLLCCWSWRCLPPAIPSHRGRGFRYHTSPDSRKNIWSNLYCLARTERLQISSYCTHFRQNSKKIIFNKISMNIGCWLIIKIILYWFWLRRSWHKLMSENRKVHVCS